MPTIPTRLRLPPAKRAALRRFARKNDLQSLEEAVNTGWFRDSHALGEVWAGADLRPDSPARIWAAERLDDPRLPLATRRVGWWAALQNQADHYPPARWDDLWVKILDADVDHQCPAAARVLQTALERFEDAPNPDRVREALKNLMWAGTRANGYVWLRCMTVPGTERLFEILVERQASANTPEFRAAILAMACAMNNVSESARQAAADAFLPLGIALDTLNVGRDRVPLDHQTHPVCWRMAQILGIGPDDVTVLFRFRDIDRLDRAVLDDGALDLAGLWARRCECGSDVVPPEGQETEAVAFRGRVLSARLHQISASIVKPRL